MPSIVTTPAYAVGDTVRYESFSGDYRYVVVDEKDEDIKNGHPGFAGHVVTRDGQPVIDPYDRQPSQVWGYDSQIC